MTEQQHHGLQAVSISLAVDPLDRKGVARRQERVELCRFEGKRRRLRDFGRLDRFCRVGVDPPGILTKAKEISETLEIARRRDRCVGPRRAKAPEGIDVQTLEQPNAVGVAPRQEPFLEHVFLFRDGRR